MKYKVKFHHPTNKTVIDEKVYDKLSDISSDLGISRHVLYRYMNNKLSDRYKSSCLLLNIDVEETDDMEATARQSEILPTPVPEVHSEEMEADDDVVIREKAEEPKESKEDILKRYREEYLTKRKKIYCPCGGKYTAKSKSTHEKTMRHKKHFKSE